MPNNTSKKILYRSKKKMSIAHRNFPRRPSMNNLSIRPRNLVPLTRQLEELTADEKQIVAQSSIFLQRNLRRIKEKRQRKGQHQHEQKQQQQQQQRIEEQSSPLFFAQNYYHHHPETIRARENPSSISHPGTKKSFVISCQCDMTFRSTEFLCESYSSFTIRQTWSLLNGTNRSDVFLRSTRSINHHSQRTLRSPLELQMSKQRYLSIECFKKMSLETTFSHVLRTDIQTD